MLCFASCHILVGGLEHGFYFPIQLGIMISHLFLLLLSLLPSLLAFFLSFFLSFFSFFFLCSCPDVFWHGRQSRSGVTAALRITKLCTAEHEAQKNFRSNWPWCGVALFSLHDWNADCEGLTPSKSALFGFVLSSFFALFFLSLLWLFLLTLFSSSFPSSLTFFLVSYLLSSFLFPAYFLLFSFPFFSSFSIRSQLICWACWGMQLAGARRIHIALSKMVLGSIYILGLFRMVVYLLNGASTTFGID